MKIEQAQAFNKIYAVDSLRDTELQAAAALFHGNIQWRKKHLRLDSSYTNDKQAQSKQAKAGQAIFGEHQSSECQKDLRDQILNRFPCFFTSRPASAAAYIL